MICSRKELFHVWMLTADESLRSQVCFLKDAGDPVECALAYDRQKADELVLRHYRVARKTPDHDPNRRKVAATIFIPFTVGGGITSLSDIRELLRAGCDKVSINTAAIKNPQLIDQASQRFGSQCIVVAIDAKREGKTVGGFTRMVAANRPGWTPSNGQKRRRNLALGKFFLPVWIVMVPRKAMTLI